jgi:quinol monooxygenase YgiN
MQMQNNNAESNKNSAVRVLAFLEAKEGKRQELIDILIPIIAPSRKEDGNIEYNLNSSIENPNELLFDEIWSNKDAFDKHYQSPESYKNRDRVSGLLVKPMEVKVYTQI